MIELIVGERQTGRTTKLLQRMIEMTAERERARALVPASQFSELRGPGAEEINRMVVEGVVVEALRAEAALPPVPVLVCASAQRAMDLYRSTLRPPSRIGPGGSWAQSWQFVTAQDVKNRLGVRFAGSNIYWMVDDADAVLASLLGVPVSVATWEG